MASFIVYGDASGQVTVAAPSVAGTNTITFPAETGTLYTTASTSYLAGQIAWNTTVQTTGFTAVAYGGYFCNTTSAAFTVTLPATPTRGQFVVIVDYAGTAATNNITVGNNGSNINGAAGNAVIKTNRQGLTLTYIDSTQGWLATSNIYATSFGAPYTISYLIVAGGGGGGGNNYPGSGGGAGGYLTGTATLTVGTTYTATVGGGGAINTQGSSSSFTGVTTAVGGGAGVQWVSSGTGTTGGTGGSGGGGGGSDGPAGGAGGAGTPGQGSSGGTGQGLPVSASGGGGGGAGAVGGNAAVQTGGNGGNGSTSSITGTPATYAGGGGGGGNTNRGSGGTGGGGTGGKSPNVAGTAGTANTGGGGGGGAYNAGAGAAGGSGVVIISIPTANYTGTYTGSPTITTSGSNTILTWTTAGSGTYTA